MCHSSGVNLSAGSSCSSFRPSVVFPEQGSPTIKWRVATLLTPWGLARAEAGVLAPRDDSRAAARLPPAWRGHGGETAGEGARAAWDERRRLRTGRNAPAVHGAVMAWALHRGVARRTDPD